MTALVKFCHKCKDEKPISEFQKCRRNKDGLQTYCKRCRTTNADVFDWKKESAERNVRRCSSCRQVLDRSLFYANSRRCKQCAKQAASDWKSQNPERARENDKQWREQNKARKKKNDRLYYVRNAEEITSRKRRQYDEDEAYRNKIRISNYNSYHRNLKRNQDVRLLRSLFAPDYIKQMKLRDY